MFYLLFLLAHRSSASFNTPLVVPFTVGNETKIQYLEHVVLEISLSLEGFSEVYSYWDYTIISNYIGTYYSEQDLEDLLNHRSARRGDISISLQSPHGTNSVLLPHRDKDFVNARGFSSWPFMSVLHWGEDPEGEWSLVISYRSEVGYVTLSEVKVSMYGTREVPTHVSRVPLECAEECDGGCAAIGTSYCDACKGLREPVNLHCIETCPEDYTVINGYCFDPEANLTYTYNGPTVPQILPSSTAVVSSDITQLLKVSSTQSIKNSSTILGSAYGTVPTIMSGSATVHSFVPTPSALPTPTLTRPGPVDLVPTGGSNSRAAVGSQLNWASLLPCSLLAVHLLLHSS